MTKNRKSRQAKPRASILGDLGAYVVCIQGNSERGSLQFDGPTAVLSDGRRVEVNEQNFPGGVPGWNA